MAKPTTIDIRRAARFIEITKRYNADGWIEYLLWETMEGFRDRPFVFLDPLPEDDVAVLTALRDETKIWFVFQNNAWTNVPIAKWREHAKTRTADDVRRDMDRRTA